MERFLKIKCADRLGLRNFDSARPYFMQFTMKVDEDTFFRTLFEEIQKPMDPLELVYPKELPLFDKYDEYLPDFIYRAVQLQGLHRTAFSKYYLCRRYHL